MSVATVWVPAGIAFADCPGGGAHEYAYGGRSGITTYGVNGNIALTQGNAPSAKVNASIAGDVAKAIAMTQFASEVGEVAPQQYLYQVEATTGQNMPRFTVGDLVWVVVYDGLSIETSGPMTDQGVPAMGATVRKGYVLLSAASGDFLTSVFTS